MAKKEKESRRRNREGIASTAYNDPFIPLSLSQI
jgi:hypothetical protein